MNFKKQVIFLREFILSRSVSVKRFILKNVGAVFCNLTLRHLLVFVEVTVSQKRILLVQAWTQVRPLFWITQCRSGHVSHVSFKCRTEKEFLLTSGLRLLDPSVHLVA